MFVLAFIRRSRRILWPSLSEDLSYFMEVLYSHWSKVNCDQSCACSYFYDLHYAMLIYLLILVIGLTALCTIQLLKSDSMYQIALDLFAYFSLVYNMNKLMDVLFEWNITMQSLKEANQYSAVTNESFTHELISV